MENKKFMVWSNLFILTPIILSLIKKEYIYLFFSFGGFIFSILYHYTSEYSLNSKRRIIYRNLDWFFALGSHFYMFYYIFVYIRETKIIVFLTALLSLNILFFIWGWVWKEYSKYHPWFHVTIGLISGFIVITKYIQ